MLVDEVTIRLTAGNGGRGGVAFSKVRLVQGPNGGDGGRGGCVYIEGVRDIGALQQLASKKEIVAGNGESGRGSFVDGKSGQDVVVKVPLGTRVTNIDTGNSVEIDIEGDKYLAAGGGFGGRGNFNLRSATNTSPKNYEPGTQGDSAMFKLELRLIADVGLVGFPNAGKSSLLNELTAAKSKVANYAFTTLEPNLGSYYGLIIADIPGLIEGAHDGKGLGIKFLKHIERTKTLFHLISAESDDPARDYKTIMNELKSYNPELAKKDMHVFLTKSDAVEPEEVKKKLAALKKIKVKAEAISLLEPESLERVRAILNEMKGGGATDA